jgi:hypothetical protein
MKKQLWIVWSVFFIVSILFSYFPKDAEAIPAFSRKYGKKCTVCHVQFPKLKKFGIAFKNRGYRMEDEEGEFIWKTKNLPIGVIGSFSYVNSKNDTGGVITRSGEVTDVEAELFAGGTLAPRISFFVDGLADGNRSLVQFDDILSESALNLKVGDFNVDNYFISRPRRLTSAGYLVQTGPEGKNGVTFANQGVELNGQFVDQGFRYQVGVGNDAATGSNHRFGNMIYAILNQDIRNHVISVQYRRDNKIDDTHSVGAAVELRPFRKLLIDAAAYQFWGDESLKFTEDSMTKDFDATSGTVEVIYLLTKKWMALARFDWHDVNDSNAFQEQYVASLQYYPAPNVKLNLEYFDKDIDKGAGTATTEERSFRAGVTFGF